MLCDKQLISKFQNVLTKLTIGITINNHTINFKTEEVMQKYGYANRINRKMLVKSHFLHSYILK